VTACAASWRQPCSMFRCGSSIRYSEEEEKKKEEKGKKRRNALKPREEEGEERPKGAAERNAPHPLTADAGCLEKGEKKGKKRGKKKGKKNPVSGHRPSLGACRKIPVRGGKKKKGGKRRRKRDGGTTAVLWFAVWPPPTNNIKIGRWEGKGGDRRPGRRVGNTWRLTYRACGGEREKKRNKRRK